MMVESKTGFVVAVNGRNAKQRIPVAWLAHPVLSRGFRLSRRSRPIVSAPSVPEKEIEE